MNIFQRFARYWQEQFAAEGEKKKTFGDQNIFQKEASAAQSQAQAAGHQYNELTNPTDTTGKAPPPPGLPPDLTDEAVKMARRSQLAQLMAGMGRRSTFLAGPMNTFGNFGKSLLGG